MTRIADMKHNTIAYNSAFCWQPADRQGFYWVCPLGFNAGFSNDGYAVIDDFGNLVKVPT